MKTLKTLAALSFALCAFASIPAHAATGHQASAPGIKTCNSDTSCTSPNGASLDGFAPTASHGKTAPGIKTCNTDATCTSPNGPSLDGFAPTASHGKTAPGIKTCNTDNSCSSPNGPSLDGIVDNDAATQKSAPHKR